MLQKHNIHSKFKTSSSLECFKDSFRFSQEDAFLFRLPKQWKCYKRVLEYEVK